jgi:hypothetical protein
MKHVATGLVFLASLGAFGQHLSTLDPLQDDAARRAQLWGRVPATSSLCIRPVDPVAALGLTNSAGMDSLYDFYPDATPQKERMQPLLPKLNYRLNLPLGVKLPIQAQILPVTAKVQYNQHHDFGWQDGPMIPNRGLQAYLSGGAFVRVGGKWANIEAQLAPEWVRAQNQDPERNPAVRWWVGDEPERFGVDPYRYRGMGQSRLHVNAYKFYAGWGTGNVQWGPGQDLNLMMSNNAPGMNHFSMGTRAPLKTKIGSFEGQILSGNLHYSGYTWARGPVWSSAPLPDVVRTPSRDSLLRPFNGIVAVYNPKFLPGLSLGVARTIWASKGNDTAVNPLQFTGVIFSNPFMSNYRFTKLNQMAGGFFRWVMPAANFEFFGEYVSDDSRFDFQDLLTSPEHTRAYHWGFRKLVPVTGPSDYWDASMDVVQIEAGKEAVIRRTAGYATFYSAGDYNNFGQNLGAGISTGSNQFQVKLARVKGFRKAGFQIDWVKRNADMIYMGRAPWLTTWYGYDFTKKWIDWGVSGIFQNRVGNVVYYVKPMWMQTYNWMYLFHPTNAYDPAIDPFRAPGWNVTSFNLFTGLTWYL